MKKSRHDRCLKRFTDNESESDSEVEFEAFKPKRALIPAKNNCTQNKNNKVSQKINTLKENKMHSDTSNNSLKVSQADNISASKDDFIMNTKSKM